MLFENINKTLPSHEEKQFIVLPECGINMP